MISWVQEAARGRKRGSGGIRRQDFHCVQIGFNHKEQLPRLRESYRLASFIP